MQLKTLIVLIISLTIVNLSFAMENKGLEQRVGIIGAGPAGMTAAWELKKKGYQNVTVLEAKSVIGGKVKTLTHKGYPYELGAVITAPDYDIILSLAEYLDLKLHPTPPSVSCSSQGDLCSMLDWSKNKFGWMRIPKLVSHHAKFLAYTWRHSDFFEPGFSNTPKNMERNFEDFMHEQGMAAVLEAHRPIMVGCGYGFAEDMPAPYWMKLMKTFAHEYPKRMISGKPFFTSFSAGWQTLWQDLARKENIDVRLNSMVTNVTRNQFDGHNQISVKTTSDNFVFDKLIVSVPHLAERFMDLDPRENYVFSKVNLLNYKVTLAEVDNLPQRTHIWLRENSYKYGNDGSSNDGKPVLISSNQNTNVYQIYQFTSENKSDDQLREIMNESLQEIGGADVEVISEVSFQYFPHFNAQAFQEGLPQQLSHMQGHLNTYYTGALMDFEIVERAAAHAKDLVEKHF